MGLFGSSNQKKSDASTRVETTNFTGGLGDLLALGSGKKSKLKNVTVNFPTRTVTVPAPKLISEPNKVTTPFSLPSPIVFGGGVKEVEKPIEQKPSKFNPTSLILPITLIAGVVTVIAFVNK